MSKLSLTACSFYLKKKSSKGYKQVCNLNEPIKINKEDSILSIDNIKNAFEEFFNENKLKKDDKINKKFFNCVLNSKLSGETKEYSYIYGIVNSGLYGESSNIVETTTDKVVHKRKPTEADVRGFHVFIVFPKDNSKVKVNKGMMFFQNFGPFGVKTHTTEILRDFFSEQYDLTIINRNIAPRLFIEKVFKKENVKKLIMIKNHISCDSADNIYRGYGVESRSISRLNFDDTKWGRIKDKINHFIKGKYNLFEFQDIEYDELKVTVKIGERDRTINLNNIDNMSIIEDVPDGIRGIDGNPDEIKLLEYFHKVTKEYLDEMVLRIE